MSTVRVQFPGSSGQLLAGQLERPEGPARAWALQAHCFTCGKDIKSMVRHARELALRGIGVLRFDFTGIGDSEGDFGDTSFSTNCADVRAAAAWLAAHEGPPALLIGHSLGGAAMVASAAALADVRLVATIAAPAGTLEFRETLLRLVPRLGFAQEGALELGGRRFTVRRDLLDDLAAHDVLAAAAALPCPLVVVHSPEDETVPFDEALKLFDAARGAKGFLALPGADHLLLRDPRDVVLIAETLAAWLTRVL